MPNRSLDSIIQSGLLDVDKLVNFEMKHQALRIWCNLGALRGRSVAAEWPLSGLRGLDSLSESQLITDNPSGLGPGVNILERR